jgi:septum formation protein
MQPQSDQKSESDLPKIILASGSESRKIMLKDAGLSFNVQVSDVDEDALKALIGNMQFNKQVIELAKAKAEVISKTNPNAFVIGGDQMCVMGDEVFHKPGSQEQAIINLTKLSNTTHYQYSGICIFKNSQCLWEYSEKAIMTMHDLSVEEIKAYVKLENPIHAAGAYKYESIGCNLFKSVEGSSYTVRGMPLLPLLNTLRSFGVRIVENSNTENLQ